MINLYKPKLLQRFSCLIDKCQYNCCSGWIIGVNDKDVEKFKIHAPEILDNTIIKIDEKTKVEEREMKRDQETKNCIMLQDNKCQIHARYGSEMLPNICSYFPNIFRKYDETNIVDLSATNCHGVLDLIFKATSKDDFIISNYETNFIKDDLHDFYDKYNKLPFNKLLDIHNHILTLTYDENMTFENLLIFIHNLSKNINQMAYKDLYYYIKSDMDYEELCIEPESIIIQANYSLIDIMEFTVNHLIRAPIFDFTMNYIKKSLKLIDKHKIKMGDVDEEYNNKINVWNKNKHRYDNILKNYLRSKLSESLFPFYYSNVNVTTNAIIFECLMIRLLLICLMDQNVDLMADQDSEGKMFKFVSVLARRFYGLKESKKELLYDKFNADYSHGILNFIKLEAI